MEHVKRLVLVPEHMAEQRKKPLAAPLATQVNEIDSDMQDIIRRQDIPIDEKAKLYDQNLQRYLTFYDKRKNKPLRVNVTHSDQAEKPQGEQPSEETEPSAQTRLKQISWIVYQLLGSQELDNSSKNSSQIRILLVGMNKARWCSKEDRYLAQI